MNREKQLIQIIQETFPESKDFIGDDAALVDLSVSKLAISTDNFIEGVHYDRDLFSPYNIGWKALAVNISDMAAMVAKPLYFVVSIALARSSLGSNTHEEWVREFYKGLYDCAKEFGFPKLIGGDLSSALHETAISITIWGAAPNGTQFLRSSAQPGDKVCVTGKFGNSGNFWQRFADLKKTDPSNLQQWLDQEKISERSNDYRRHLRPSPRLGEALNLEGRRAALMDTSDGLAQALIEISKQSKVNIEIDSTLVPKDLYIDLSKALFGAEDYELLVCCKDIPAGFIQIGQVKDYTQSPSVVDLVTNKILEEVNVFQHFN